MGDRAARCGHCDGPLVVVVDLDSTEINHRLADLERGLRQIMRILGADADLPPSAGPGTPAEPGA